MSTTINVNYVNICNLHLNKIKRSAKHTDIINNIIDDMLMNKVYINNAKIYININRNILNLINEWYNLSSELQEYNNYPIVVYRGIKNIDMKDTFLHPIPFSTCVEYDNALNWINFNDLERSFILKIHVCPNTSFTFTGNFNEGNEVILPAGMLHVIKIYHENNVKIVECSFEQFSYNEMIMNITPK